MDFQFSLHDRFSFLETHIHHKQLSELFGHRHHRSLGINFCTSYDDISHSGSYFVDTIWYSASVGDFQFYNGPDIKLFILVGLVGAGAACLLLCPPGFNGCFSFAPDLSYLAPMYLHRRAP